jgi:hypothetical protein
MHRGSPAKWALALVAAGALTAAARSAQADDADKTPAASPSRPHFVGDLRALFLVRNDNNYFGHANAYSYPMDPLAPGVELNLGAELLPRVTLSASGLFAIDGANRDSAQMRLQSAAALGMVRWAFVRAGDSDSIFDLAVQGGFGRYVIKETYLDPALSSQTFEHDSGDWGGTAGIQASLASHGFLAVLGYGYHVTPASISDRIGGTVSAGGHEVSIGLGVFL